MTHEQMLTKKGGQQATIVKMVERITEEMEIPSNVTMTDDEKWFDKREKKDIKKKKAQVSMSMAFVSNK